MKNSRLFSVLRYKHSVRPQGKQGGSRDDLGFTIVETMIVLAIASLILFLALVTIPILERNSRNNQRKQDVATILEAISHYELANSGNMPTTASDITQYFPRLIYYADTINYSSNAAINVTPTLGAGVYISPNALSSPTVEPIKNPTVNQIEIYNYQICNTLNATSTNQGAEYSDVVALYALESSDGSPILHCEQL
jgi:prepilin-type N-terminal cleavage/methylation domain-containing protein